MRGHSLELIKVTVIVPIYNVKPYIKECLDSLERQTLNGIEVIMVNDGSTDGSEVIAAEYTDRYSYFSLINRENGGLSAARNTGLEYAKGKYVYFLDGDDYLADSALEELYLKAEKENLDQIRFSGYTFKDGTNDFEWARGADNSGFLYIGSYPDIYSGTEIFQRMIDNGDYYPSCTMIFNRRSIIEDNDLKFFEGILHEDELFNYQITNSCKRVSVINRPFYYRRIRPGSIVTSLNYLLKMKSLCIIAEESDKFISVNPNISYKASRWLNWYFALFMLYYWANLSKAERESTEVKQYFDRLKPLLKKYDNYYLSVKLFYLNKPLYSLYKRLKKIILNSDSQIDRLLRKINKAKKDPHTLFWIFTPLHGNIGDQAIAVSEKRMLDHMGVRCFEVSGDMLSELYKKGKLNIFNGSPILFHGGGYLGTLWYQNEVLVRNIITCNPGSSILFLPNTLYFDDNETGRTEYKKSAEIYRSHNNIKIYAREQISYKLLMEMGVNAAVVPDMVLRLKEDNSNPERSGCLLLLRNDCEKTRNAESDEAIIDTLRPDFGDNIKHGDTALPYSIDPGNREHELEMFLNMVRSYELVITDRLHGMIISAITGTSCIVISSKSHKLTGCYEWIKDLDYIRFCDDPEKIIEIYSEMPHGSQTYNKENLLELYSGLKEDILRLTK